METKFISAAAALEAVRKKYPQVPALWNQYGRVIWKDPNDPTPLRHVGAAWLKVATVHVPIETPLHIAPPPPERAWWKCWWARLRSLGAAMFRLITTPDATVDFWTRHRRLKICQTECKPRPGQKPYYEPSHAGRRLIIFSAKEHGRCRLCGCKMSASARFWNKIALREDVSGGCPHPDGSQWEKHGAGG